MLTFSAAQILCAALIVLAAVLGLRLRENRRVWPFLALTLLAAVQAALVSLRWDFGLTEVRLAQIILTCLLPPAAWLSFRVFTQASAARFSVRDLAHLLPALAVFISYFAMPDLIDPIIILNGIGYGISFVRLLLRGEEALGPTALGDISRLRRALGLIAFSLLGSAAMDIVVLADFAFASGANAPALISIGNIILLAALIATVISSSGAVPKDEATESSPPATETDSASDAEDRTIVQRVRLLLVESKLAQDPDLTLNRIARRLNLPARAVSRAINRIEGCNVSQFVNTVRIGMACGLMTTTDQSITAIIFESGFQSKSNFNREFLRIIGQTPRDWRQQKRPE